MNQARPSRGQVWSASLDPVAGREQGGLRPVLVLSVDKFNHGPADIVIALPITSNDRHQPIHVAIRPPEGGLPRPSFVKCEDIRSISKERLVRLHGEVSLRTLSEVEQRVRILLDL